MEPNITTPPEDTYICESQMDMWCPSCCEHYVIDSWKSESGTHIAQDVPTCTLCSVPLTDREPES